MTFIIAAGICAAGAIAFLMLRLEHAAFIIGELADELEREALAAARVTVEPGPRGVLYAHCPCRWAAAAKDRSWLQDLIREHVTQCDGTL